MRGLWGPAAVVTAIQRLGQGRLERPGSCCWSSKICWSCAASLWAAVMDREASAGAEVAAMQSASASP